jgi:hypothetical protein
MAALLDFAPPRPIDSVPHSARAIALRNPAIRFELEGAEVWDLAHAEGEPPRDEIRLRVEGLVNTLSAESSSVT